MRFVLLLLAACKGADPADSGETDVADTDPGVDTDDTELPGDVNPTISALDAWCWQHTTGDERWLWKALAFGTDPQGTATLDNFGHEATILRDGDVVVVYQMICEGDGDCSATWNQDEFGVLCAEAPLYTIRVRIEDVHGNWSLPIEVQGRVGTGDAG